MVKHSIRNYFPFFITSLASFIGFHFFFAFLFLKIMKMNIFFKMTVLDRCTQKQKELMVYECV